jgi:hypothetical protein
MMRRGHLTILGGAIACAAGLFGFHRMEQRREVQELERQQEMEQLRRELLQVKQDGASRARLAGRLGSAWGVDGRPAVDEGAEVEATVDAAAEAPEGATPDEADKQEMSDEEMKTLVLASVHSTFDAEPRDAAWSNQADRQLTAAVNAGMPKGSSLDKAECRTSLCKVETHHGNLEEFRSFVNDAFMDRERQVWNGGFYAAVVDQSDEGVVAVSYLAKEGQSVPLPEIGN